MENNMAENEDFIILRNESLMDMIKKSVPKCRDCDYLGISNFETISKNSPDGIEEYPRAWCKLHNEWCSDTECNNEYMGEIPGIEMLLKIEAGLSEIFISMQEHHEKLLNAKKLDEAAWFLNNIYINTGSLNNQISDHILNYGKG
jgi:hypothetical protein